MPRRQTLIIIGTFLLVILTMMGLMWGIYTIKWYRVSSKIEVDRFKLTQVVQKYSLLKPGIWYVHFILEDQPQIHDPFIDSAGKVTSSADFVKTWWGGLTIKVWIDPALLAADENSWILTERFISALLYAQHDKPPVYLRNEITKDLLKNNVFLFSL